MSTTMTAPPAVKKLTGWHVLLILFAFFGMMFTANGALVYFALTTFGGTEVASSYQAGRVFNADLARARAQELLGWKVSASATRSPNGEVRVEVRPRDINGAPVAGLDFRALLARPVDRRADVEVILRETEVGAYVGTASNVPAGNWDLELEAHAGEAMPFQSRNRLYLKE